MFLGDVMLVFGGNSHNGTLGAQSNQPCFATDFVAYDIGTCTLNNNEPVTTKGYGERATTIENQNVFAPSLCFA